MKSIITFYDRNDINTLKSFFKKKGIVYKTKITPTILKEKEEYENEPLLMDFCNFCLFTNSSKQYLEEYLKQQGGSNLPSYYFIFDAQNEGIEDKEHKTAIAYSDRIVDVIEQIKEAYLDKSNTRPWVIASSGGKDSSLTLLCVWEAIRSVPEEERTRKILVITSDTGLEPPPVTQYAEKSIRSINQSAKEQNLPIEGKLVFPRFEDRFGPKVIGRGVKPTVGNQQSRQCTYWWKIQPANHFLSDSIEEFGEVVVFTGVRSDESESRKRNIEKYGSKENFIFTKHDPTSRKKSKEQGKYACHPIKHITTEEVWDTLEEYSGRKFPWGVTFAELQSLYEDSGECPMQIDEQNKNSCGTSRNGCMTCMMVKEDSMLNYYRDIKKQDWATPMMEFRNKMYTMLFHANWRRNPYKDKEKNYLDRFNPFIETKEEVLLENSLSGNGSTARKRILKANRYVLHQKFKKNSKSLCENSTPIYPDLALGSFSLQARIFLLKNVLYYQKLAGLELVKPDEIEYIKQCWREEFDWIEQEGDLTAEPIEVEQPLSLGKDYTVTLNTTEIENLVLPDEYNYKRGKQKGAVRILNPNPNKSLRYLFYVHREMAHNEETIINLLKKAEQKTRINIPYFFNNGWRFENGKRVHWNVVGFVLCREEIKTQQQAIDFIENYIQKGEEENKQPDWNLFFSNSN